MKDAEPPATPIGAYVRTTVRDAQPLASPLTTDLFGTEFRYYARVGEGVYTSASVRALARRLGRVTINPLALAEILAFGFVLRDETVLNEIRSIPPHTTLHVDGTLTTHAGPEKRARVTDAESAARRLRGLLEDVVRDLEPRWDVHCAGFTGGKDSRMLAALPKGDAARWHWLTVSGRGDAEHEGSVSTAARLGLEHFEWMEWTSEFLSGAAHRVSADLANGVGAVSDHTLLRSCVERYRAGALGRSEGTDDVALWIGSLADGLFAGTYLMPPAATITEALRPRTAHLSRVLAPPALARFEAERDYYDSNTFAFTTDREVDDTGYFIRLFTRGRCYVCRSLSCFDHVARTQVNPYLHPEMIALALETDASLLAADSLRDGVLRSLGPGLDAPSAFGYRAPPYAHHVFRALAAEIADDTACRLPVSSGLAPALVDAMREGRFPDVHPNADGSPAASSAPAYRVHAAEAQPVIRSLRDYEHLLVYVTFLNLLTEDGVEVA